MGKARPNAMPADTATADAYEGANCWEVMKCGREPGGSAVGQLGTCIAAVDSRLDGIHGGVNAGRCCWLVAGTFCGGQVQGTFAQKRTSCEECEFYQRVQRENALDTSQTKALALYLTSSEARERQHFAHVLSKVIDHSVLPLALANLEVLKRGEERHITAFFSDLSSFSAIGEKLDSSEVTVFLDEYFSAMTDILKIEGGTIDKYVGDGMIGMFGAPLALENDACAAAQAALRMESRLGELRQQWRQRNLWCQEAWSLQSRIGLSSGLAKVGFFGSRDLRSYSMTGSTVNLASWLEQACKHYGTSILVSEKTHSLIRDQMVLRRLDRVRPKGRSKREAIYELLGERGGVAPEVTRSAELFEVAQDLCDRHQWSEAAKILGEVVVLRGGNDPPAERLRRRYERLAQ